MALTSFGGQTNNGMVIGLAADTKPPAPQNGLLFIETDTALMYVASGGSWVIKTTGANLSLTDITTNDVSTSKHGFFPKLPTATGKYLKDDLTWATIAGGGDVVGPAVAVASQIALFDGTTGKLVKADTTTGIVKATAGVISAAVGDTDYALPATVALKAPLASPTLVTPVLGVATATTVNKVTITAPASSATLTIANGKTATLNATTTFAGTDGKTLTVNNSITLAGTDSTTMTFPATTATIFGTVDAIPAANVPNGISTLTTAIFSQAMSAGTFYYVTGSSLTMPATSKTGGGMSTSTTMQWQFMMSKTAAGTAAFNVCIYRGINGSTSDTRDVTQSIGTATAVVDIASVIVTLKVTATGGTGSYTWGIAVQHKAATAAGFGTTDATPFFSGTVSSVAMNTASLKFGIGLMGTTGTTTLVLSGLTGQVNNMN